MLFAIIIIVSRYRQLEEHQWNIDASNVVESNAAALCCRDYSVFHKRLRKLVNFSEITGRKMSFRDVDAERIRIQFLRCIPDMRRRAFILNEAISWIEGNAIFDDVCACMSMLLRFLWTFQISESFRSHDDFTYSIPRLFLHNLFSRIALKFHDLFQVIEIKNF